MAKLLRVLLGAVLLSVVLAGWFAFGLTRSGLPQREGQAKLAGLSASVKVDFDAWGVPHIQADSWLDAAAAIGWCHANDRMTQMELGRRSMRGRLSEVAGEAALRMDGRARELQLTEAADAIFAGCGPESKAELEAYATGVNAWLQERGDDLPPGLRILRVTPEAWTPQDSLAFALLMARDLSILEDLETERLSLVANYGPEIAKALLGREDGPVLPELAPYLEMLRAEPPAEQNVLSAIERALGKQDTGEQGSEPETSEGEVGGSNNWAVNATRTASGTALVANDPHLALRLPSPWYQASFRSSDYTATGFCLIGLPSIIVGQSEHLAWAVTNCSLDNNDLFLEGLSDGELKTLPAPSSGTAREFSRNGEATAVSTTEVITHSRDGQTAKGVVLTTNIGPLLLGRSGPMTNIPYSLAWSGGTATDSVGAFRNLVRATSLQDARTGFRDFIAPAQNLLIADDQGSIVQTILGRQPNRAEPTGWLPTPANRLDLHWQGHHPQSEMPWIRNPKSGVLATANNDVRVDATNYEAEHSRDQEPSPLWLEYDTPHRANRARQILSQRKDWTVADMVELQRDTTSLFALEVVSLLNEGLGQELEDSAARTMGILREWDGNMQIEPAAYLYRELERKIHGITHPYFGIGYHSRARILSALRGELPSRAQLEALSEDKQLQDADGYTTDTWTELLAAVWDEAVESFGTDQTSHWNPPGLQLELQHPLSAVPVLGRYYTRGPFPVSGSSTCLSAFSGNSTRVTWGPSMRWVADAGAPDRSVAGLPGGQSGHPFDPHYSDQIEPFLAGELHPILWSDEARSKGTVSTLELIP